MGLELEYREPRTERHIPVGRRHGARVARTAGIERAVELARRIVLDLEREYGVTHAPLDPDRPFGINAWVYRTRSGDNIDFEVYGMVDAHLRDPKWCARLRVELEDLVAQYNWSSPTDPADRRFGGGAVFLCTEAEERARGGRSAEVRVYRRWLGRLLGRRFRPYLPVACD
ncbi:hypothetical protein FHX81_5668 [Saccharothrix saharensis]|uniref:Uncharacterized protein n=1 Tax=Saccharothrix saharensis TaxID=571190 RepID=A0A543JK65_9PSEU|nr:hypothetical protein FHX81_5668 [Saccharothrix saharensis]